MKFLNSIDLNKNEIQNVNLQTLGSDPADRTAGAVYYNSAAFRLGLHNGTTFLYGLNTADKNIANGVASLDGSIKVVQDPASAATTSGGATGKIPISSTGGRLDVSYIPTLNSTPAPTASVAMNSQKITGLATCTADDEAANKAYVDAAAQGLRTKAAVVAATTTTITLSGTQTIDGVAVTAGQRVLVKYQSGTGDGAHPTNGVYTCNAGAWTREAAEDTWSELMGAYVFISGGTVNGKCGYSCTIAAGGTLDTTNITWQQFSAAGSYTASNYAGTGTGQIYRDTNGSDFRFKRIGATSNKIAITNGADDVTIDVAEANFTLDNMAAGNGYLGVARGGTGRTTSTTAYGLIAAGTTATGAHQTLPAGSTGEILSSGGASALPTWVASSGTGNVVRVSNATLVAPTLGVAQATSYNGLTVTTTTGTLTLVNGSSLITAGAFSTTLTATAATNVTLPTSGTLLSTAAAVTVAQGGTGATTLAAAKTALGYQTKYAANCTTATTWSIPQVTHGLTASQDILVTVLEISTGAHVYPDIATAANGDVTITFSVAPTAAQYRAILIG